MRSSISKSNDLASCGEINTPFSEADTAIKIVISIKATQEAKGKTNFYIKSKSIPEKGRGLK